MENNAISGKKFGVGIVPCIIAGCSALFVCLTIFMPWVTVGIVSVGPMDVFAHSKLVAGSEIVGQFCGIVIAFAVIGLLLNLIAILTRKRGMAIASGVYDIIGGGILALLFGVMCSAGTRAIQPAIGIIMGLIFGIIMLASSIPTFILSKKMSK